MSCAAATAAGSTNRLLPTSTSSQSSWRRARPATRSSPIVTWPVRRLRRDCGPPRRQQAGPARPMNASSTSSPTSSARACAVHRVSARTGAGLDDLRAAARGAADAARRPVRCRQVLAPQHAVRHRRPGDAHACRTPPARDGTRRCRRPSSRYPGASSSIPRAYATTRRRSCLRARCRRVTSRSPSVAGCLPFPGLPPSAGARLARSRTPSPTGEIAERRYESYRRLLNLIRQLTDRRGWRACAAMILRCSRPAPMVRPLLHPLHTGVSACAE